MKRRAFLKTLSVAPLALHGLHASANTTREPVIAIITFRGSTDVEKGFKSYLAQAGLEPNYLEFDIDRNLNKVPNILQQLRPQTPDLVLTWGTSVTQAVAGTLTQTNPDKLPCPTVFALVTAPVASGIVESLEGSSRNVTGVFHVATAEQQIQAIEKYRPLNKLGMIYTPTENNSIVTRDLMQTELALKGIAFLPVAVDLNTDGKPVTDSIENKIQHIAAEQADWLYLPPDSFIGAQSKEKVIPTAHKLGLPTFATTEQLFKAGALMGLTCSYFEVGQFAGFKAEKILKNKQFAGSIPVETLQTYRLGINPEQAKTLGMPPPLNLFNMARFES